MTTTYRLILNIFTLLLSTFVSCSDSDPLSPIEDTGLDIKPSVNTQEFVFEAGKFLYKNGTTEWLYDPDYQCMSTYLGEDISDIDSICFHIGGCNSHVGTIAFADKDFNLLYKNTNYDLKERTVVFKTLPEGARWLFCNSNPTFYDKPSCTIVRKKSHPETEYTHLYGKNILMLGDSQTEFRFTPSGKGISEYSCALIDPNYGTTKQVSHVIRGGIGGAHLSARQDKPTTITSTGDAYALLDVPNIIDALIDQDLTLTEQAVTYLKDNAGDDNTPILQNLKAVDMSQIDVVTVFAGTNDWNSNVGLGKPGDTGNINNYYGAINYITSRLQHAHPHIKVVFFTPVVRWTKVGNPDKWSDVNVNRANLTLVDVTDAMLNACQLNGVPCYDLYRNLGWNMENFDLYFQDTTHCTKGYHIVAQHMMQFINSLYSNNK